jgi:prepilin-type N-terminal cleavage/methylation domain-containing protein
MFVKKFRINKFKINKSAFSLIEISIVILIIGILVAGVTQASRLVLMMKIQSAKNITTSGPVMAISGLISWYEPVNDSSFDLAETDDQAFITNWYDSNQQISEKNNLNSTGAFRPKYKKDCINNLPCVEFSNAQYLQSTREISLINNLTIFLVIRFKAVSTTDFDAIIMTNGPWVANNVHFQTAPTSPQFLRFSLLGWTALNLDSTQGLVNNRNYLFSVVDNSSSMKYYFDGTLQTQSTIPTVPKRFSTFCVGCWFDGGGRQRYLDAFIAEIIMYDRALTNEERIDVEKYLAKKWAIKLL